MPAITRPLPNYLTGIRQGNGPKQMKSAAVATLAAIALHTAPPCSVVAAPLSTGACDVSSCVSTGSYMKPSQYLPPMQYAPMTEDAAEQQLLRQIQDMNGSVVAYEPKEGAIQATIPYSFAGREEIDLCSFHFISDPPEVLFRCEALTKLPGPTSPPFCWKPGCISGPRQRARMASFQDALGWTPAETDEDKKWVQILLH